MFVKSSVLCGSSCSFSLLYGKSLSEDLFHCQFGLLPVLVTRDHVAVNMFAHIFGVHI